MLTASQCAINAYSDEDLEFYHPGCAAEEFGENQCARAAEGFSTIKPIQAWSQYSYSEFVSEAAWDLAANDDEHEEDRESTDADYEAAAQYCAKCGEQIKVGPSGSWV